MGGRTALADRRRRLDLFAGARGTGGDPSELASRGPAGIIRMWACSRKLLRDKYLGGIPMKPEPPDSAAVFANEAGGHGDRSPCVVVVERPGRQTAWWMMTVAFSVLATAVVLRWDETVSRSAVAQLAGGEGSAAGARGIYAFTGPLSTKSYGLFMLDVDTGTVWCYEMEKGREDEYRFKLVGARSWIFDRYLEEFNVAKPTPSEVRLIVQQQRSHREQGVTFPAGAGVPEGPPEAGSVFPPATGPVGPGVSPVGPALPANE